MGAFMETIRLDGDAMVRIGFHGRLHEANFPPAPMHLYTIPPPFLPSPTTQSFVPTASSYPGNPSSSPPSPAVVGLIMAECEALAQPQSHEADHQHGMTDCKIRSALTLSAYAKKPS